VVLLLAIRDDDSMTDLRGARNTIGGSMTCTHRHVVVTGASSGIGRATALRLAGAGWHVYAGVRNLDDTPPAQMITSLLMDVTNAEQIGAAVESVAEHVGPAGLNALVDNAGIGVAVPMELVPLESLRRQLEVNVVGQVAVTQAFLPMLRRARGRVVFIGSIGDRFTPPFGGPLAASKSAIASIADAFRQELAPWNIDVVLLEPASIHTDAVDKLRHDSKSAVDEFSPDGAQLYRDTYLGMVAAALKREQKGSPPDVVAEKVQTVLTTARPRPRYLVGKDARMLANLVRFVPTSTLDALRRRIFKLPAHGSRAATPMREGVSR
jgi:NAD(P)-dependent dehydrogenase (short-subunit alcohol dehydrogenase family)